MGRLIWLIAALASTLVTASRAGAVTIAWVSVGNAGNANDPADGDSSNAGIQNYGGVPYNYSIDKYDVTVGQYTDFLNSVAATDTYRLYNASMGTDQNIEGIARGGSSGSYTYGVIGSSANLPITYVSWGDAARFANGLQNGQSTGAEGAGTTETGAVLAQRRCQRRDTKRHHAQRRRDNRHPQRERVVQGGLLRSCGGPLLELRHRHEHHADFIGSWQHAEHGQLL